MQMAGTRIASTLVGHRIICSETYARYRQAYVVDYSETRSTVSSSRRSTPIGLVAARRHRAARFQEMVIDNIQRNKNKNNNNNNNAVSFTSTFKSE